MKEKYENLIQEWHKECTDKGVGNYFIDGPISEKYWEEDKKILVVNLEAYGYEKCGVTYVKDKIKEWMTTHTKDPKKKTKTTRYTSVFVKALLDSIDNGEAVTAADMRKSYSKYDDLCFSMDRVAYINLRKTSSSTVEQSVDKIRAAVESDREYLLKQIEVLAPDIIISGGQEGARALNILFDPDGGLPYKGVCKNNDSLLVSARHFSRVIYADLERTLKLTLSNN